MPEHSVMMKYITVLLFSVIVCQIKVNSQCDHSYVAFHCYNSIGAEVIVRDNQGAIIYVTQIVSYTVANNFIFELDLEPGCYTIRLTNDTEFTTYLYGVDSNGWAQYVWYSEGNAPEFPFSVGGTGGCSDPVAVNYIPGACAIPDNNTICQYEANNHFITMEICETLNGIQNQIAFTLLRSCNGSSIGVIQI